MHHIQPEGAFTNSVPHPQASLLGQRLSWVLTFTLWYTHNYISHWGARQDHQCCNPLDDGRRAALMQARPKGIAQGDTLELPRVSRPEQPASGVHVGEHRLGVAGKPAQQLDGRGSPQPCIAGKCTPIGTVTGSKTQAAEPTHMAENSAAAKGSGGRRDQDASCDRKVGSTD